MSRVARDYVSPNMREYRGNGEQKVGSFTRGNARSSYLGRENTRGLLAKVGNPANPSKPQFFAPRPKSAETRRNEAIEARTMAGKPCPGCGMRTSVPKTCFCW